MQVQFTSPFQAEVELIDYSLVFARGEIKDVPADIGIAILGNVNFVRVADAPPVSDATEQPA